MTYGQLKQYVAQLQLGGYDVVPYLVALQRKVAFPFVTVVMTLLAVPFAVSTGRRGALYGVGIGIVLAITFWLMQSGQRGDRRGRPALACARGVDAQHPLRRRSGVSDSDGQNVRLQALGARLWA